MRSNLRIPTLVAAMMLAGSVALAADLINASFEASEGCTTQNYAVGTWTKTVNTQTWTGSADNTSTESPGIYTSGGATGSARVQFRTTTSYIMTPQVTDPGTLTFYVAKSGGDGSYTMKVQTSTATTGPWTDKLTFTNNATDMPAANTWYAKTVSLEMTGSYYIRFIMSARTANSSYLDYVVLTPKGTLPDNPDAVLNYPSISFGKINSVSYREVTVNVRNAPTSTNNLVISSPGFNFTGSNPTKFSVVNAPTFPVTLAPSTSATLTIRYTPGEVAAHSATATLASNDANNPTIAMTGEGATVVDVATLTDARALADDTLVRVTGSIIVTVKTDGLNTGYHQFYAQDTSGTDGATGICIYDSSNLIGFNVSPGDELKNMTGSMKTYNGNKEIIPTGSCDKVGTAPVPAPKVITSADATFSDLDGELIRIQSLTVNPIPVGGSTADTVWGGTAVGTGKNYTITPPAGIIFSQARIEEGSEIVGVAIPTGTIDLTGIAIGYSSTYQIEPRYASDQGTTGVEHWNLY